MTSMSKLMLLPLLAISAGLTGCDGNDASEPPPPPPPPAPAPPPPEFIGAVYVGDNRITSDNSISAFGRSADGTLTPIGRFATDGRGGIFDGTNDGLDPLISEDSVISVEDRFLLTVNAGSNTVSSFRIAEGFSLEFIGSFPTGGMGPNSIAYNNGIVYVSNADTDGQFIGAPDQVGNITGFRIDLQGVLTPIDGSTRQLQNRPSNVEFSPDGEHLVISSWNAGSTELTTGSDGSDEIVVYGVDDDGLVSAAPLSSASSTPRNNAAGRNLAAAIGIEVTDLDGRTVVIATEAREFLASGVPAMLPMFQTGSVSTWELNDDGSLSAISLDVLTGPSVTDGPTSACWVVVSPDQSVMYVSSASGAVISTFSLDGDGSISLIDGGAAVGSPADPTAPDPLATASGFIDVAISSDGETIYQLFGLQQTIGVYQADGEGGLSLIQQTENLLRVRNIQGIVFVGRDDG